MTEHRHRRRDIVSFATMITIAFLILPSASDFGFNPTRHPISAGWRMVKIREEVAEGITTRRRMGGLGSSPPPCRSKCGWCTPCKPVHVPVPPRLFTPLDYYPEAWRCECGNKLFTP